MPDDPLAIVDADFPTALRGYDRMAVDEYVRQTRQLVAELQATRSPEAAVRRALERVGEQISGILQRAHETAEQITAQSRSEAEDRLEQARRRRRRSPRTPSSTSGTWTPTPTGSGWSASASSPTPRISPAQLLALAKTAAERFPADADGAGTVLAVDASRPETDGGGGRHRRTSTPPGRRARSGRSEVERTVAFQPLEADEERPPGRDRSEAGARGPPGPADRRGASRTAEAPADRAPRTTTTPR